MFLSKLNIKNYRCFENEKIENLATPNGSEGSGLNILIGENGNGKTTVLEAIKLLTQSRLKTRNVFSIKDFKNLEEKVEIEGICSDEFNVKRAIPVGTFKANGFYFYANLRQKDDKGNLVEQLVFDNQYIQSGGPKIMDSERRLEVQNPFGQRFSDMQIIYLDKRRARSVSEGEHPDKFNDLLADFNFQFSKDLNNLHLSEAFNNDLREKLLDVKSDKILTNTLKEFKSITSIDIKLDHLNIVEPFTQAFFALRDENTYQQINISKLGSGIEMIFSILFLKNYYALRGVKTILLIDEPELHLHPKLQELLIKILLEVTKDDQVIVSTHSPYLFKNLLSKKCALFLFTKDNQDIIAIEDARKEGWGLFEWSPSWGEINYFAYDLPTVEFHNELYGYIQWKNGLSNIKTMETFLDSKGIIQDLDWLDDRTDPPIKLTRTLCTYVRNSIHHPENTLNQMYSETQLKQSIELMINILKKK